MIMNDIEFERIQFWIQVPDLELWVLTVVNARKIGEGIGECIEIEEATTMIKRGVFRIKVETDASQPLTSGFLWKNLREKEHWADVIYEGLSDMCYECERLGYTSYQCKMDTVMSEVKPASPMYEPWVTSSRPHTMIT